MTEVNREAPDLVSTGVQTLVETARRLGLEWTLRMATVQSSDSSSGITAIYDGDTEPITMLSLTGLDPPGARVSVIQVPPAGNYIIGTPVGNVSAQMVRRYWLPATSDVTLTTTAQLMPGTQVRVAVPGTFDYEAIAFFDFDETVAGTTLCIGELFVNGAAVTSNALFQVTGVDDRATVGQSWTGTANGESLIDIRARRSVNAGTQIARGTHTTLLLKVYQ